MIFTQACAAYTGGIANPDPTADKLKAHKSGSVLLDNIATIASSSRKSIEASNELSRRCVSC